MKLIDLIKNITAITINADLDMEISGISYDSRTIKRGDLFVAIRGYEFDGHKYIDDAIKKGAACIICEEESKVSNQYVLVENSRIALALISATWFKNPSTKIKVIGVTGTNGKTTVTTLLKNVLEYITKGKTGLIGTNGNYIGDKEYLTSLTTPEAYDIQRLLSEMVDEKCEYAVMEVSSHALSLHRVHGIMFEVGVFTNLTPEHLDFHNSMEQYAKAKSQLFSYSRYSAINIDNEYARTMIESATGNVFTYSVKKNTADLVGKDVRLKPNRVDFCALTIGNLHRIKLNIPGMFSVYNALAIISTALLLGFEMEDISSALDRCNNVKGRVEIVPTGTDYTVIIDYAHTASALKNVILMARECYSGRVVTLFGCGGDRDNSKRPEMGRIAAEYSDYVIVTSDNPRTEDPELIISQILTGMSGTKTPYEVIVNRLKAIHWALENSRSDDVLILAGKGHETYQIVGKEKKHFDEREIVADYYNLSALKQV